RTLGAVVAKTTTPYPRPGNPAPRNAQGHGWTLNSIGLKNPGIEAVLKKKAPQWATWEVPVILSIGGEAAKEYSRIAAMVEGAKGIAALELNLSCPNVAGGLDFGQNAALAAEVTREVKAATSLPVLVKLTPNVTDIVSVASAVAEAGADAITLVNTLVGMAIDVKSRKPVLPFVTGGTSGPALKPVALAAVFRVHEAVDTPLIGAGGISTVEDVLEFLLAGACAIQVGTANFGNPFAPVELVKDLERYCARHAVHRLSDLVGAAHQSRQHE
ncbi:MAG: dihydroorotate dehydrogenase, partial [Chloroflexi bacterium]|nr:dihydroorotate dehydrogenase [Chloroflexota bacterium]